MIDAASSSDFCKWLAATPLSHTIQTTGWIIPALQTIHILCVAVLFSSAVIVDLRIWRLLQRDVPLPDVARRFLPVIWPVVLILLLTGSLLIVGEPRRSLLNTTFYIKMALLAVALVLTGLLQWSLSSVPEFWDRTMRPPRRGDCCRDRLHLCLVRRHLCRPLHRLHAGRMMLQPQDVISFSRKQLLADSIRENDLLFPLIESVHVLAICLVVGSILVVDLRLLGFASTQMAGQPRHAEFCRSPGARLSSLSAPAASCSFPTPRNIWATAFSSPRLF